MLDMCLGFKWEAYLSTFGPPQKDRRRVFNFASLKNLLSSLHLPYEVHCSLNT